MDDPQGGHIRTPGPSWVTAGSLHAAAWRLALPTIGVTLIEVAYTLVELYFVGKLGKGAIGAITLGAVTVGVIRTFCIGITSACSALVAQAVGSGNRSRAEKAAGQGLLIALALSAVVAAVGVPLAGRFIGCFSSRQGAISQATLLAGTRYLQVAMAGSFALLLSTAFAAALHGAGDTVTPLLLIGLGSVASILLNPILIFGWFSLPALGVAGAALARVLGKIVAAALLAWVFFLRGHTHFHLHLRDLKPDVEIIRTMFKIGIFGSGQALSRNISALILARIVSGFGEVALGAHGIAMRLRMAVMMPGRGFGVAASTMVGQSLGARDPKRAERAGWLAAGLFSAFGIVVCSCFWFFAENLVAMFNSHPDVVATGARFLRWFSACFFLMAFMMVLYRAMNGAGDTFWPMLLTACSLFLLRIPLAYKLSQAWQRAEGVWAALTITILFEGLLAITAFRWGRWKRIGRRHVRAAGGSISVEG